MIVSVLTNDRNLAALGGSISSDLFQDAAGLEEDLAAGESDTWREWPLTATDGDSAALIQLVSDNKVGHHIPLCLIPQLSSYMF